MMKCDNCGAECREAKDLKRFARRHPKRCKRHERFQQCLAEGIACVEADEEQEKQHAKDVVVSDGRCNFDRMQ